MDDSKRTKFEPPEQQLVGFMTNEEWDELVATVASLLAEVESIPYPGVKEKVFTLLQAIDGIHREPLHRLVHVFKEGVLEKVITDPAIHTLMELYDLLPKESAHAAQPLPVDTAQWRARLAQMTPTTKESAVPHWVPALRNRAALPQGQCEGVTVDDQQLLLCRVGDEFFAVDLQCTDGDASLAGAALHGYTLVCPNHKGCYYDVRDGRRIGGTGVLTCYPVKADDDGRVLVGFGIPYSPKLPSF